jgi:hypothetical protein
MDNSVWITNGLMWLAIAMSPIALWASRSRFLARVNGRTEFQALVGLNVAVAIAALILTLFTLGYAEGKARAFADNRADAAATVR